MHEANGLVVIGGEFLHGDFSAVGPPPVGIDFISDDVSGDVAEGLFRGGVSPGEEFEAGVEPSFSFRGDGVEGSEVVGGVGVVFGVKEDAIDGRVVGTIGEDDELDLDAVFGKWADLLVEAPEVVLAEMEGVFATSPGCRLLAGFRGGDDELG